VVPAVSVARRRVERVVPVVPADRRLQRHRELHVLMAAREARAVHREASVAPAETRSSTALRKASPSVDAVVQEVREPTAEPEVLPRPSVEERSRTDKRVRTVE
jgi:hypothetical protein